MREINWKSKPQELLLWYLKEEEEVEMKMISIMNKCWKGEGFPFHMIAVLITMT